MKENIFLFIKVLYRFLILLAILGLAMFINIKYTEYTAQKTIISDYLISKSKINKVEVIGLHIKPSKISVETDDGLYTMNSDNRFKTLKSVNTLHGEDFGERKLIVQSLKTKKINNVKKGSLTYKGKGMYEAYDFDTKHTYVVSYDEKTGDVIADYKEIE